MKRVAWILTLFFLFPFVALADDDQGQHHHEGLNATQLGTVHFPVSCAASVQKPFERGVALLHSFWYEEAEKEFVQIAIDDPHCAMAHWGVSYASGPNYNLPWVRYDPHGRQLALSASYEAMQAAIALAGKASPVEQAMIRALSARYPQREAIEDMAPWDKAYTKEMRKVFEAYPDDLEAKSMLGLAIDIK